MKEERVQNRIDPEIIKKYLGLPKFRESRLFDSIPPPGVMIGLAYNAFGGSIMYIEAKFMNLDENTKDKIDDK